MSSRKLTTDGTKTKGKSKKGNEDPTAMSEQQMEMMQQFIRDQKSQQDGLQEKFLVNLNDQMYALSAEHELKNQQNDMLMKAQQRRIIELQQAADGMKSEMNELRNGRGNIFNRTKNLQSGLDHMDMLADFELLSKGSQQNQGYNSMNPFKDDALSQFMSNYVGGGQQQPMNGGGRGFEQQQFPQQIQNFQDDNGQFPPPQSSQSRNRISNAGSFSLSNQRFHQPNMQNNFQGHPQQFQQNHHPQKETPISVPSQERGYSREEDADEGRFDPIFKRIEQQNQMLMKLMGEMDKKSVEYDQKQSKSKKPSKKKNDDSFNSSSSEDTDEDNDDEIKSNRGGDDDPAERKILEKRIKQLQFQIDDQRKQNMYMMDNNIQNPDVRYLAEAAQRAHQQNPFAAMGQQNPYSQLPPEFQYILQQSQQPQMQRQQQSMPQLPSYFGNQFAPNGGGTPFMNPGFPQQQFQQQQQQQPMRNNNLPSPDEFLKQVQMNGMKFGPAGGFQSLPFGKMNQPNEQSGLGKPQFINDQQSVPHPDTLAMMFQQQLRDMGNRNR